MTELACKDGVTPAILWIAAAVTRLAIPVRRVTITAGDNGVHSVKSLHYKQRALDLRTKDFPNDDAKREAVRQLKADLGKNYDVILEGLGTINEHIHCEYDPKPEKS